MIENHPKCATCKHFDPEVLQWDNALRAGTCNMIPESWEVGSWDRDTNLNVPRPEAKGHLATVCDYSSYEAQLLPTPDFYCPLHSDLAPEVKPYRDWFKTTGDDE